MGETKNTEAVEAFIKRWQGREGGQERANYVSFLNELIALLGLPPPDPADATHEHNDYVFERAVKKHKDEGDSQGRIDLYKKNSFVLEAKQSRLKGVKKVPGQNDLFTADIPENSRGRRSADRAWDVLMLNAKRQAEEYARALPTSHGWPPFILVCDVGHCIEVYADFSGQGKNYTQFPVSKIFALRKAPRWPLNSSPRWSKSRRSHRERSNRLPRCLPLWPPPANRSMPRASRRSSSEPRPPRRRSAKSWPRWRDLATSRRKTARPSRCGGLRSWG
jgi:hypothetical protein